MSDVKEEMKRRACLCGLGSRLEAQNYPTLCFQQELQQDRGRDREIKLEGHEGSSHYL